MSVLEPSPKKVTVNYNTHAFLHDDIAVRHMFNLLKDQIKLYENVTSIVTCILIIIKLLKELNLQEYLVAVRFRDKS